jgi:bifunctional DNA-binding transcriptional regulator/antitoxin component of YhaV-PrlF toxin-antitoxin module
MTHQVFGQESRMDTTIKVRKRGIVTLPANLCNKYGIREGDTYRVIDLGGTFVLAPMVPTVLELARQIESARVEAGLSTEELLRVLREERTKHGANAISG